MIWLKNIWYGMPLYVRPVLLFLYRYFIRRGFLDGWNGFVYHALQTFWFRLIVDVHIADYRRQLRRHTLSLEELVRARALFRQPPSFAGAHDTRSPRDVATDHPAAPDPRRSAARNVARHVVARLPRRSDRPD